MRQLRMGGLIAAALAVCAILAPAAGAATTATGSFQLQGLSNGLLHMSASVTPASTACEDGGSSEPVCNWSAYVEVVSGGSADCQMWTTTQPLLGVMMLSQTSDTPTTQSGVLDAEVLTGTCELELLYEDGSSGGVLASQTYTFPKPNATFSGQSAQTFFADEGAATTQMVVSEPVCPSNGECAWFPFVNVAPASAGCPALVAADGGGNQDGAWVGDVLDGPGTETVTMTQPWDPMQGPMDWCAYVDGPAATVADGTAGLVGVYTQAFPGAPVITTPTVPTVPTTPPKKAKKPPKKTSSATKTTKTPTKTKTKRPQYAMTSANARRWVRSAVLDHFYHARARTKLRAFTVRGCHKLTHARFHCRVAWRHANTRFSGTVTVGHLNARTGRFRYGFSLTRQRGRHGRRHHIAIRY